MTTRGNLPDKSSRSNGSFQKCCFSFFQLFGEEKSKSKFDPLTNQTEIWECTLKKKTFKIKISCLSYAIYYWGSIAVYLSVFLERVWFKDYLPLLLYLGLGPARSHCQAGQSRRSCITKKKKKCSRFSTVRWQWAARSCR